MRSTCARAMVCAGAAVFSAGVSSIASGAITSVTGNTTWLGTPPASCLWTALTGFNAFTWDEQQAVTASSLFVDMVNNPGSTAAPTSGVLTGVFNSHFIHFDNVPGVINATGTVSFNAPIVGVIFNPSTLDATDAPFGAGGTLYPTLYPFRGLGTNPPSVCTVLGNTITFNLFNFAPSVHVAQVRVLTAVPTPGSVSLLAGGGLLIATSRRRRRRAC